MPTVTFYRTTSSGSVKAGEIRYFDGKLEIDDAAREPAKHLLEGAETPGEILDRLQRAPSMFDGAYFRAAYVG